MSTQEDGQTPRRRHSGGRPGGQNTDFREQGAEQTASAKKQAENAPGSAAVVPVRTTWNGKSATQTHDHEYDQALSKEDSGTGRRTGSAGMLSGDGSGTGSAKAAIAIASKTRLDSACTAVARET